MYFIALIAAETSKFFFTLKYQLDTLIRIKTVEPFESAIKFECCNYYLKSNRSLLVLFSFVLTIEGSTAASEVSFTCNVAVIMFIKQSSKFNIVSMVTDTLTGIMGYTPILSVKVSIKKIKGAAHKNSEIELITEVFSCSTATTTRSTNIALVSECLHIVTICVVRFTLLLRI